MKGNDMYSRKEVVNALRNAPRLRKSHLSDLKTDLDKLKLLLDIKELKGLWLLSCYGRDRCYSLIADFDGIGEAENKVDAQIGLAVPHDMLYKLKSEVLGTEDGWFTDVISILQKEIMDGRIYTIYLSHEWKNGERYA